MRTRTARADAVGLIDGSGGEGEQQPGKKIGAQHERIDGAQESGQGLDGQADGREHHQPEASPGMAEGKLQGGCSAGGKPDDGGRIHVEGVEEGRHRHPPGVRGVGVGRGQVSADSQSGRGQRTEMDRR